IEIFYSEDNKLKSLSSIKKNEIKERLITFEFDFAIIVIAKKLELNFRQIRVSNEYCDEDVEIFTWGFFATNPKEVYHFELKRNDILLGRFKAHGNLVAHHLNGLSGSGIFHANKSVLFGCISRYPTEDF